MMKVKVVIYMQNVGLIIKFINYELFKLFSPYSTIRL